MFLMNYDIIDIIFFCNKLISKEFSKYFSYIILGGISMEEMFEYVFHKALLMQATDIHLYYKDIGKIKMRCMGQIRDIELFGSIEVKKLINYLKYKAQIDISKTLSPQTGTFKYTVDNKDYFLRISSIPGVNQESVVVRILNNHKSLTIDELCIYQEVNDIFHKVTNCKSGLFLLSGPTGSGKSTTMHTILSDIFSKFQKNIITIEDPIEIINSNFIQIEINEILGANYQDSLKQILRHDPDIVMIGEVRDEETAALAISCALTGRLVLTTIHSKDCELAIERMINLGVNRDDLKEVLIGVTNQRMFYNKSSNQRFCLYEVLAFDSLNNFYAKKNYKHKNIKFYIKESVENRYLALEDIDYEFI